MPKSLVFIEVSSNVVYFSNYMILPVSYKIKMPWRVSKALTAMAFSYINLTTKTRLLNHELLALLDINTLGLDVLGRIGNLATHQVIDYFCSNSIGTVF